MDLMARAWQGGGTGGAHHSVSMGVNSHNLKYRGKKAWTPKFNQALEDAELQIKNADEDLINCLLEFSVSVGPSKFKHKLEITGGSTGTILTLYRHTGYTRKWRKVSLPGNCPRIERLKRVEDFRKFLRERV